MKTRIKELIKKENTTSAQFASEIGIAASSLHHIVSGRNNPSLEVIQKILERFPELNAEWLINGKGKRHKAIVQGQLFDVPITENKGLNIDSEPKLPFNDPNEKKGFFNNANTATQEIPEAAMAQIQSNPKKAIEKIMILYTDKSFDVYQS